MSTYNYSSVYGENYDDNVELSNYTWYCDKNNVDNIGINKDGSQLIHDSMVFTLKKFRKIEKMVSNTNTIQLVYKLDNRNGDSGQTQPYFSDLVFSEKSNYLIFKYVETNGNFKFTHIVFNGKIFK